MHVNHRLMYTGSQDGVAKCWVTEFGDNTVNYTGHTMSVTVIKFHKGLRKKIISHSIFSLSLSKFYAPLTRKRESHILISLSTKPYLIAKV